MKITGKEETEILKKRVDKLEKKVEHFSNMGSVTSDYSIINELNTITYIGKVKTKLNSK